MSSNRLEGLKCCASNRAEEEKQRVELPVDQERKAKKTEQEPNHREQKTTGDMGRR